MPSLSLADEAVELFADRARLARPDFAVTDDNAAAVAEICARLDGLPLAIELAAARVRALSLAEILDSLHDRFRLLTGGARTAVRRQQTLRASVDWSHALLTEPERVLFRRLAVFLGGFDLDAAQAVAGARRQWSAIRSSISSPCWSTSRWWWPKTAAAATRYRLLETVRQYALEKLERVRRGRCRACASSRPLHGAWPRVLDAPGRADYESRLEQVDDRDRQPARRVRVEPRKRRYRARAAARVLAAAAVARAGPHPRRAGLVRRRARRPQRAARRCGARCALERSPTRPSSTRGWPPPTAWIRPNEALALAREVDDPALLARALTACGFLAGQMATSSWPRQYLAEAIGLARAIGRSLEAEPDPGRCRRKPRSWRGDPLGLARPARKDATSPTRSATGSTHVSAAMARVGAQWYRAIWPGPSHNSTRWRPRPRRPTTRSGEGAQPRGSKRRLAYQGEVDAARAAAEASLEADARARRDVRGYPGT